MQNIDTEIARRSWANAPDKHVKHAIENISDYNPQVINTIISEAKKRFDHLDELKIAQTLANPKKRYEGTRRIGYWLGMLVFTLIANTTLNTSVEKNPYLFAFGLFVIVPCLLSLTVSRLHNIGISGWWAMLAFVPIANLFVGVPCAMCPEGYKDTKKLDIAGKIIAGIFITVSIIVIWNLFSFYFD